MEFFPQHAATDQSSKEFVINGLLRQPPLPPGELGLAIVLASSTPLVLLDAALVIQTASGTFCRMFGIDPQSVSGRSYFSLGSGEWDIPRLRLLFAATMAGKAAIDVYELDLVCNGELQHLVLNAQRLTNGDKPEAWLLLAVNNVTEARITARQKDDLVQEKQVLLQELQHRVANSLQIIASVLMLGARKVQSDEARIHLNDAHQRVMAIAKLQHQLSTSGADGVPLGTYLEDLCGSIAASMILQPDTLKITTAVDDYVASPEQSVSFGLIVTELVINALKHAFPDHLQHGIITVDFTAAGVGWTLAVSDNGIGKAPTAQPGLGTGIIEALAKQLNARIEVRDADPGTRVLVIHDLAAQQ